MASPITTGAHTPDRRPRSGPGTGFMSLGAVGPWRTQWAAPHTSPGGPRVEEGLGRVGDPLVGAGEASFLLEGLGGRLGEPNAFFPPRDIEVPGREGERALPTAAIPPHQLAGGELETREDRVVEAEK